jgi:hypothetical protein
LRVPLLARLSEACRLIGFSSAQLHDQLPVDLLMVPP